MYWHCTTWAVQVGKSQTQIIGKFVLSLFLLLERFCQLVKGGGRSMQKILVWNCSGEGLEWPRLIPGQHMCLWVEGTNPARTARCNPINKLLSGHLSRCLLTTSSTALGQNLWECILEHILLTSHMQCSQQWVSGIESDLLLQLTLTNGSGAHPSDTRVENNHSITPQC